MVRGAMALATLLLASCAMGVVEVQPDPAEIPRGPLRALGAPAVGPIVELGSGRTSGVGWRYSAYPSADGTCTVFELASFSSGGCGDVERGLRDGVFGSVGHGGPGEGPFGVMAVDGTVRSEVAAVWLLTATGERVPTTLLSLAPVGHDGQVFLGFGPPDTEIVELEATDEADNVVDTFELP